MQKTVEGQRLKEEDKTKTVEGHKGKEEHKKLATAIAVALYLLAAVFVCAFLTSFNKMEVVTLDAHEPGITDLTGLDFSQQIAMVGTEHTNTIHIYKGVFYTPADFAAGKVTQEGVLYNRREGDQGDYGTLRMVLKLPPGHVYAIAAKNVSYGQRLFIDGREYAPVGMPADTAEAMVPQSRRYIEAFYPTGETTEFIFHYSAFVHADGGGLYPMNVGYVENVTRSEQRSVFQKSSAAAMMLTVMVFFFGLFLFFRSHRYLLWFSLLCGSIAFVLLGESLMGVLMPDFSWYAAIRIAYLSTCAIGLFSVLYISALFPGIAKKWMVWGFFAFFVLSVLFIAVSPTTLFTRYPSALSLAYAVFSGYILVMALIQSVRGKLSSPLAKTELWLLLAGLILFLVFSAVNTFTYPRSIQLFGLEYQTAGIIIFLYINMLALVLGFSHTQRQLSLLREKEWEITETNRVLARLNRAKTDFLGNISHEMKTPLAVISNCAGVTLKQFRRNAFTEETEKNLDDMQHEAVRLGKLVEQLLTVAMEKERQLTLVPTDAKTLLCRAADFCTPICQGRKNRITLEVNPAHIPLLVNPDAIFQVLVNLITNADRQMEGGVITLSAGHDKEENCAFFQVVDNGSGIAPELFDRVFERGVSGGGSSGLGLPICEEIIREHGGTIHIESSSGGTAVRFKLPCKEDPEENGIEEKGGEKK